MSTTNLQRRARQAASAFLAQRGFEIQAEEWSCEAGSIDFVATDEDGDVHFVQVASCLGDLPEMPRIDQELRNTMEHVAMSWLDEQDTLPECAVTFDVLSLGVLSHGRAFLKFCRNMLSVA